MKKVFFVLFGIIPCLFLANLSLASNTQQNLSIQSATTIQQLNLDPVSTIPTRQVLRVAARMFRMPFGQLKKAYDRGQVTIVALGHGKYLVETIGGNVAIVVLDSL